MAETKRIKFLVSRGSPVDAAIIRVGTVTDFPVFWADRFIADGTAIEVKEDSTDSNSKTKKPKGKK
jgi:hypothetical protein